MRFPVNTKVNLPSQESRDKGEKSSKNSKKKKKARQKAKAAAAAAAAAADTQGSLQPEQVSEAVPTGMASRAADPWLEVSVFNPGAAPLPLVAMPIALC